MECPQEVQREIVERIQAVIEERLTKYTSFEIHLPESSVAPLGPINFQSFVQNNQELADLGSGPDGQPLRLSPSELQEIFWTGRFSVASNRFPGKAHTWRVSSLLARGMEPLGDEWKSAMGSALDQLLVYVPDRLTSFDRGYNGTTLSIPNSLLGLYRAVHCYADKLVGLPQWSPLRSISSVEALVEQEQVIHLLRNHDVRAFRAEQAADTVEHLESLQVSGGHDRLVLPKFLPSQSPDAPPLDMRFSSPSFVNRATNLLNALVSTLRREWLETRDAFILETVQTITGSTESGQPVHLSTEQQAELLATCLSHLEQRLRLKIMASEDSGWSRESLEHLCTSLDLGAALDAATKNVASARETFLDQRRAELRRRWWGQTHAYFSRRLNADYLAVEADFNFREEALRQLEQAGLRYENDSDHHPRETSAYYVIRQLRDFDEGPAVELRRRLTDEQGPSRIFTFERRFWFKRNWRSVRGDDGLWRLINSSSHVVSSSSFGWRLHNFFARTYCWTSNWLGFWVHNLWSGPLGLRALLSPWEFHPHMQFDHAWGAIGHDQSKPRATLLSRIATLWRSAMSSIRQFEAAPDRGILGKRISRLFNRIWNYGFKLGLGSSLLLATIPVLSIANLSLSLGMLTGTGILVPSGVVLKTLFNFFIYDLDNAQAKGSSLLFPCWSICCRIWGNVFRLLLAGGLGVFGHPAAAVGIFTAASLHTLLRGLYDLTIHYLVLRPLARRPAHDSPMAVRVSGPGLSSAFYDSISTEQVLFLLHVLLEHEQQELAVSKIVEASGLPAQRYSQFMQPIATSLGCSYASSVHLDRMDGAVRQRLSRLVRRSQIDRNWRALQGHANNLFRVRQSAEDLETTLVLSERLVRDFYENRMLPFMAEQQRTQLWVNNDCPENAWSQLTRALLSRLFGTALFEPLTDGEMSVQLDVSGGRVTRFVEMLSQNRPTDELHQISVRIHKHRENVSTAINDTFFSSSSSRLAAGVLGHASPLPNGYWYKHVQTVIDQRIVMAHE